MKLAIARLFGVLLLLAIASDAFCVSGNANLVFGTKYLKGSDWTPVDDHSEGGVSVNLKADDWPLSASFGLLYSIKSATAPSPDGDETLAVEGVSTELRAGLRKHWEPSYGARPFCDAGLLLVYSEFSLLASDDRIIDSDTSVGFYGGGGLQWTLHGGFNIGCELSYSYATARMYDLDGAAGGVHVGILLGYHW